VADLTMNWRRLGVCDTGGLLRIAVD